MSYWNNPPKRLLFLKTAYLKIFKTCLLAFNARNGEGGDTENTLWDNGKKKMHMPI